MERPCIECARIRSRRDLIQHAEKIMRENVAHSLRKQLVADRYFRCMDPQLSLEIDVMTTRELSQPIHDALSFHDTIHDFYDASFPRHLLVMAVSGRLIPPKRENARFLVHRPSNSMWLFMRSMDDDVRWSFGTLSMNRKLDMLFDVNDHIENKINSMSHEKK